MIKYIIICIIGFLWSTNSIAQNYRVDRYQVLVGKTKSQVIDYFNELYSHTSNTYKKIESTFDEDGDIKLKVGYAMSEEDKFSCLDAEAIFTKIGNEQICVVMLISGTQEYGDRNINYLKDNFIKLGSGNFEGPSPFPNTKIKAKLIVDSSNNLNMYAISYSLSKN